MLKTGGSAFEGFHRDEMTTLPGMIDDFAGSQI